jgi:subtilisin family serine protease
MRKILSTTAVATGLSVMILQGFLSIEAGFPRPEAQEPSRETVPPAAPAQAQDQGRSKEGGPSHAVPRDYVIEGPPEKAFVAATRRVSSDRVTAGLENFFALGADRFVNKYRDWTSYGRTVKAAVFDEGAVLDTHQEFRQGAEVRVTKKTQKPAMDHPTEVASVMAAWGEDFAAMGIARAMRLDSYDWDRDLDNLKQTANQIQVSNHSYVPPAGWYPVGNDWRWYGDPTVDKRRDAQFGKYTEQVAHLDQILVDNPHLLTFVASGNARNLQLPKTSPFLHKYRPDPSNGPGNWVDSQDARDSNDAIHGGCDTIAGLGLAKNAICVGAGVGTDEMNDPIQVDSYSSWGPADDGRIKPDLIAIGDRVHVATDGARDAYTNVQGSSFAAPAVAAVGALLAEFYWKRISNGVGDRPPAALIKALLIHTARDAGRPGPDPETGWGLVNTMEAGRVIDGVEAGQILKYDEVGAGKKKEYTYTRPDALGQRVRVTLVWSDPAAPANTKGLDDTTSTLVNDLDVELIAPGGATHYQPYSLNRSNPRNQPTTKDPNRIDNVEVIDIDAEHLDDVDPARGKWTIRVRAERLAEGKPQRFALIVSAMDETRYPSLKVFEDLRASRSNQPSVVPLQSRVATDLGSSSSTSVWGFATKYAPKLQFGKSVTAGIFDEGAIDAQLTDFMEGATSRVTVRTRKKKSVHSTEVAIVMAGNGPNPLARGVAWELRVLSFDEESVLDKLQRLASEVAISNHSYSKRAGWGFDFLTQSFLWFGGLTEVADASFGKYSDENRTLDRILFDSPQHLAFVAAGNAMADVPPRQPIKHYAWEPDPAKGPVSGHWVLSTLVRKPDRSDRGALDTIASLGLSKNAICVGAIEPVYGSDDPYVIAPYSSWGPADDGRVKPDLVAAGRNWVIQNGVRSEVEGTAFATPTVAGLAALLIELFRSTFNRQPTSAEVKALLIHTARDAGQPGPDPQFGWGAVDALAAGDTLTAERDAGRRFFFGEIQEGSTNSYVYVRREGGPRRIRVTLVWTDPPGPANRGGLDDRTPALVNDLDLELEAPSGTLFYPYSMNSRDPLQPASSLSPNKVDNVEVIDVFNDEVETDDLQRGEWKIGVKGTRLSVGPTQKFALIVSSLPERQSGTPRARRSQSGAGRPSKSSQN